MGPNEGASVERSVAERTCLMPARVERPPGEPAGPKTVGFGSKRLVRETRYAAARRIPSGTPASPFSAVNSTRGSPAPGTRTQQS